MRWLLDSYPDMQLVQQTPRLGQPGLTGAWRYLPARWRGACHCPLLPAAAAAPTYRCRCCSSCQAPIPIPFVPHLPRLAPATAGAIPLPDGSTQQLLTEAEAALVQRFDPSAELDTIGFFIAKFVKQPRQPEQAAAQR